jgi:hypothetical protein
MKWIHTDSRDRKRAQKQVSDARLNQDVSQRQENLTRRLAKEHPANKEVQRYKKSDTAINTANKKRVREAVKERQHTRMSGQ